MLPSVSFPEPLSVVELTGSVKVISLPAFAVGETFIGGFTVIETLSVSVAPSSSVTVILNTYVPCISPVTVVTAEEGFVMLKVVGPLTLVHATVLMLLSGSLAVPFNVTVDVGSVMV